MYSLSSFQNLYHQQNATGALTREKHIPLDMQCKGSKTISKYIGATILTDQQSLEKLMTVECSKVKRWALYFQQVTLTIKHVQCKNNILADWLSRSLDDTDHFNNEAATTIPLSNTVETYNQNMKSVVHYIFHNNVSKPFRSPMTADIINNLKYYWLPIFQNPRAILTTKGSIFVAKTFVDFIHDETRAAVVRTLPYYPHGNAINETCHRMIN